MYAGHVQPILMQSSTPISKLQILRGDLLASPIWPCLPFYSDLVGFQFESTLFNMETIVCPTICTKSIIYSDRVGSHFELQAAHPYWFIPGLIPNPSTPTTPAPPHIHQPPTPPPSTPTTPAPPLHTTNPRAPSTPTTPAPPPTHTNPHLHPRQPRPHPLHTPTPVPHPLNLDHTRSPLHTPTTTPLNPDHTRSTPYTPTPAPTP